MINDLRTAALRRYHDLFDPTHYNAITELVVSNLYTERDDSRVSDGMVALQDACLELAGHPDLTGACHRLAVFCGQNSLSFYTVDAMRDFLRRFDTGDDLRIADFDSTARALLRAYSGLDDLKSATAHANGVHAWQGRAAYALLHAVEYLTVAAAQLLQHGDEAYIREKLQRGIRQITGALYEGVRHSGNPSQYVFRGAYFPNEGDAPTPPQPPHP
ncbi:MAG: hypothetical protein IT298_17320 [Chloroflexi bacterium]|nr:hypothetical protein [Chloroflexota bacterium]RIK20104.1 MAG: hypothetical protein DCC53_11465 [Chloroflexota bacterium]